jgi:hypothetical protein
LQAAASHRRGPVIQPGHPVGGTAVVKLATAVPVAREWRVNGREAN